MGRVHRQHDLRRRIAERRDRLGDAPRVHGNANIFCFPNDNMAVEQVTELCGLGSQDA